MFGHVTAMTEIRSPKGMFLMKLHEKQKGETGCNEDGSHQDNFCG
jgi:hypothetical protein